MDLCVCKGRETVIPLIRALYISWSTFHECT